MNQPVLETKRMVVIANRSRESIFFKLPLPSEASRQSSCGMVDYKVGPTPHLDGHLAKYGYSMSQHFGAC